MSPQIDPAASGVQSHAPGAGSGPPGELGGSAADILRAAADRIDRVVAKIPPNLDDHRQLVGFLGRGNTVPLGLVTWLHVAPPQVIGPPLAAWLRDGADRCAEAQARWEAGPQWLGVGDDDLPPKMTAVQVRANVEHRWRHELAVAHVILGGPS